MITASISDTARPPNRVGHVYPGSGRSKPLLPVSRFHEHLDFCYPTPGKLIQTEPQIASNPITIVPVS
jgi:hypothetical protein